MSGFKLIADPDTTEYRVFPISSQAYAIGDSVDISRTAADVVPSSSSSLGYTIRGVSVETHASTDTSCLVALCSSRQRWVASTTNAANVAHNGQRMVLTNQNTVNNTGTDSTTPQAVFEQIGVVGTNLIVGRFLQSSNVTA